MDPAILLFRLIARIATSEGVTRRPRLDIDPVQGGSVSMHYLFLYVYPK